MEQNRSKAPPSLENSVCDPFVIIPVELAFLVLSFLHPKDVAAASAVSCQVPHRSTTFKLTTLFLLFLDGLENNSGTEYAQMRLSGKQCNPLTQQLFRVACILVYYNKAHIGC
jgi:hypothetical protein